MKKFFKKLLLIFTLGLFVLIGSCASSYNAIYSSTIKYNGISESDGVWFEYKYDVLQEAGNKKYAQKEVKKGYQIISVKITNNSDKAISFADHIKIFSGTQPVIPEAPEKIRRIIKQTTPAYLLYGLLWLNISKCENLECESTSLPIGIPIAIGNMIVSGAANGDFLSELRQNNLINKVIEPGETAYGLMGVKSTGYGNLNLLVE